MDLKLNEDQQKSLKALVDWYRSDQKTATLIGAAGTGKTTMAKAFFDKVGFYGVVSAPTHRASFVFSQKTKRKRATLQYLLGFQPNYNIENFNINKAEFEAKGIVKVKPPMLPTDEASMIKDDMNEYLKILGADYNFKTLYIGDKRQLPPVGQDTVSSVFSNVDVITELKTIVRQSKVNSLTVALLALRIDIAAAELDLQEERVSIQYLKELCETGVIKASFNVLSKHFGRLFKFLLEHNLFKFENDEGFKVVRNGTEFNTMILNEVKNTENDTKVLAFYNNTVDRWNSFIRASIAKNPNELIEKGDKLTGYKNNGYIFNSCDYTVLSVEETEKENIPVFKCFLRDELEKKTFMTFICKPDEFNEYTKFQSKHEAYHKQARRAPFSTKKALWSDYNNWMGQYQTLESMNIYDMVAEELEDINPKNLPTKTIGRGHAITVHKSQGGTYDSIFIDGKDLLAAYRQVGKLMFYKLLYVAASRPRNKCILYFP